MVKSGFGRDERVLRALHELRVRAEESLACEREAARAAASASHETVQLETGVACRKNSP